MGHQSNEDGHGENRAFLSFPCGYHGHLLLEKSCPQLMRLLLFIFIPWLLAGQEPEEKYWVKWNDEWTTPYQREFADWSYHYGSHTDRGHTLLWLGKSESSWGVEIVGDGGKSLGPFQMDSTTALWVSDQMGLGILPKDIRTVLENDRPTAADMALWYFDYWYEKHLAWLGAGPNHKSIAWARAVASYRTGYKWEKVSDDLIALASYWIRWFKKHY